MQRKWFVVLVLGLFLTVFVSAVGAWPKKAWADCSSAGAEIQNDQNQAGTWSAYAKLNGEMVKSEGGNAAIGEWVGIEISIPKDFIGSVEVRVSITAGSSDSASASKDLNCAPKKTTTPIVPSTPIPVTPTSVTTEEPELTVTPVPTVTVTTMPNET